MLAFYRDLLGCKVVLNFEWPVGDETFDAITALKDSSARVVMLRIGNAHIELFEYSTPRPAPGDPRRPVCDHGITHIAFEVVDIQEEYARLKAAGMAFHCAPLRTGAAYTTYGRDPDGNVIELLEIIRSGPAVTGVQVA